MYLKNTRRIITVGDGDLSFSLALNTRYKGIEICATVLDSEQTLRDKYPQNAIDELVAAGQTVLFSLDITKPESFVDRVTAQFDLALFQFPLVPNAGPRKPGQSWHQGIDSNLQNRQLLQAFLHHSGQYLLADDGARLACITSKDVKPYCDWHIECLGDPGPLRYAGKMPFNPGEYPGYRVRNVDRDKQVKSTAAITYIWTDNPQSIDELDLVLPKPTHPRHCPLCDVGPVEDEQDWRNHLNSRQHKRRAEYQQKWKDFVKSQITEGRT